MGVFSKIRERYNLNKIFRNNQTNVTVEHHTNLELWLRADKNGNFNDLAKNDYTITKTGPGPVLQSKYSATAVDSIDLLEQTKYNTTGAGGLFLTKGPMTISFWIRASSTDTSGGSVLAKEDAWEVYVTEPARSVGLRMYCGDRDGSNLYSTRGIAHANTSYIFSQATLPTDEWVYVTITKPMTYVEAFTSGDMNSANPETAVKIYFNGVLQTASTGGNHANGYEYFVHNSNELTVGYGAGEVDSSGTPGTSASTFTKTHLNAQLSDISLWSSMYTADEVQALFQAATIGTYHLKSGFLTRPPRVQIRDKDQYEYMPGNYGGYDPARYGGGNLFFDDTRTVERKTGAVSYPTCLELGDQLFDDIYVGAVTGSLRVVGDASGSFNTWDEFGYKAKSHGQVSRADADFTAYTPYHDSKFYIDDSIDAFKSGTSDSIYPGLSASLKNKVAIAIPLNKSTQRVHLGGTYRNSSDPSHGEKIEYPRVGVHSALNGPIYNWKGCAIQYFNFQSNMFEPIGPPLLGHAQTGVFTNNVDMTSITKVTQQCLQHSAVAMGPFTPSSVPVLSESVADKVYTLNQTPDLLYQQGRPITNFGFPYSGRYHATGSQTFRMSDYINAPFALEYAVLTAGRFKAMITGSNLGYPYKQRVMRGVKYYSGWSGVIGPMGSNNSNGDDLASEDCWSFFLLRQSTDDTFSVQEASTNFYTGVSRHVTTSSIPGYYYLDPEPSQLFKVATYVTSSRELIGYGQLHWGGYNNDTSSEKRVLIYQLVPFAPDTWLSAVPVIGSADYETNAELLAGLRAGNSFSDAILDTIADELHEFRNDAFDRDGKYMRKPSEGAYTYTSDFEIHNAVIPMQPKNISFPGDVCVSDWYSDSGHRLIFHSKEPITNTGDGFENGPINDAIKQRFLASTMLGKVIPETNGDPNATLFDYDTIEADKDGGGGVITGAVFPKTTKNVMIGRVATNDEMASIVLDADAESSVAEAPYILYPNDELLLGITEGHLLTRITNGAGHVYELEDLQLTLYGSYLRSGRAQQPRFNQNLESPAVRESIGDTLIFDQWDIERPYAFKGSFPDDIMSGSSDASTQYAAYDGSNHSAGGSGNNIVKLARRASRSVSAGTAYAGGSLQRTVRHRDQGERWLDSIMPDVLGMVARDTELGKTDTNKAGLNLFNYVKKGTYGILVGPLSSANDPHWVTQPYMFPFESRYNGLGRSEQLRIGIRPLKAVPAVSDATNTIGIYKGSHFVIFNEAASNRPDLYNNWFIPAFHGVDGQHNSNFPAPIKSYVRNANFVDWPGNPSPLAGFLDSASRGAQTEEELFTLIFGIGEGHRGLHRVIGAETTSNPYQDIMYGYTIPRGWKYGIANARPKFSSAVFRRDRFGQFRDMLEQRPLTVTVNPEETGDRTKAVECQFLTFGGEPLADSDRLQTQCSNLSTFATSSVPFFDRDNDNFNNIRPRPATGFVGDIKSSGPVNRDEPQGGLVNVRVTDTIPIPGAVRSRQKIKEKPPARSKKERTKKYRGPKF